MTAAPRSGSVRCAIYTRKSSDEGLEQAFNSLDAQREACAAYILSQASEGWVALPDIYDDDGLSGGTLERPALQRLLVEVAAGRIDIIVVYKVDRLTRSLLDFSRLVEAFDKAGTSFVSVTQSFNTTTSMGRLTLNMLLSFAQFEREVTAERIRDKIAASKAKGMWMGGVPPLGYAPDGRSLKIVDAHAALVRTLFERYLAIGNVRLVAESLMRDGITTPERTTTSGRAFGGGPLTRGQIYLILQCPTYVGEVHHGGNIYPGLHQPIIDRDLWEATQARLASNVRGERRGERAASPSLLAGKVVDADGVLFTTSHACKRASDGSAARRRYRYYLSREETANATGPGMRVPAGELETAVGRRVAALFENALGLVAEAWLEVSPSRIAGVTARCAELAARLRGRGHEHLRDLVERVRIRDSRIEIDCATSTLADLLGLERAPDAPTAITLACEVRLTRSGRAMRLVHDNGAAAVERPNAAALKLLVKARAWWARLRQGEVDITRLAEIEGANPAYITRVVRLAFLSPAVVDAILAGRAAASVDAAMLVSTGTIVPSWSAQAEMLLPAS